VEPSFWAVVGVEQKEKDLDALQIHGFALSDHCPSRLSRGHYSSKQSFQRKRQ
jgi:hypothetical protein